MEQGGGSKPASEGGSEEASNIYIYKGYLAERRETAGWGVGARLGRGQYLCGGNICAGVISVRGPKIKQSAPSMLCPRPAGGLGPAHARGREVVRAHSFDCACVRACVRSCERSSFARACACACAGLGPAEGIGLTGRSTLRSTHRRE